MSLNFLLRVIHWFATGLEPQTLVSDQLTPPQKCGENFEKLSTGLVSEAHSMRLCLLLYEIGSWLPVYGDPDKFILITLSLDTNLQCNYILN